LRPPPHHARTRVRRRTQFTLILHHRKGKTLRGETRPNILTGRARAHTEPPHPPKAAEPTLAGRVSASGARPDLSPSPTARASFPSRRAPRALGRSLAACSQALQSTSNETQVLVLSPTRELAEQTQKVRRAARRRHTDGDEPTNPSTTVAMSALSAAPRARARAHRDALPSEEKNTIHTYSTPPKGQPPLWRNSSQHSDGPALCVLHRALSHLASAAFDCLVTRLRSLRGVCLGSRACLARARALPSPARAASARDDRRRCARLVASALDARPVRAVVGPRSSCDCLDARSASRSATT